MDDLTIRDRRPADLPGCVAVLAEVHRHDRYPLNWPSDPVGWLSPPGVLHAWVAEMSAGAVVGQGTVVGHVAGVAHVAGVGHGAVVGHVAVHRPEPGTGLGTAEVSRLFVAPTARGHQVGAELLGQARSWATAHRIALTLEIVDESRSAPAIALYERTGWRHVDTVTATWRDPDGRPVRLRRYVGSA